MHFTAKLIPLHLQSPNSHQSGGFSRNPMEKADFSCVAWTTHPCCTFPFLSLTLLSPASSSKVGMTVFSHRLIYYISDLLFPHINADCIYSSDLARMIEGYTLQIICQL